MPDKIDKYNPEFPYEKHEFAIVNTGLNFPTIERTNNALLFPEGIKEGVDIREFKPGD
jgi:hypothetical protein